MSEQNLKIIWLKGYVGMLGFTFPTKKLLNLEFMRGSTVMTIESHGWSKRVQKISGNAF